MCLLECGDRKISGLYSRASCGSGGPGILACSRVVAESDARIAWEEWVPRSKPGEIKFRKRRSTAKRVPQILNSLIPSKVRHAEASGRKEWMTDRSYNWASLKISRWLQSIAVLNAICHTWRSIGQPSLAGLISKVNPIIFRRSSNIENPRGLEWE
jgi:hypothetical protein